MAESPEHQFLSEKFLEILRNFSKLDLYDYTEADRRRYDFACSIKRNWKRSLVGQTLWQHKKGIDKDIRMLLTEENASIWAYIVRDEMRNHTAIDEVVRDFGQSRYNDQLFRLKVFRVPSDFDADDERQRELVAESLKASITKDILLNVIFGNLAARDLFACLFFPITTDLQIAVLHTVAIHGFSTYKALLDIFNSNSSVKISMPKLKQCLLNLSSLGFLLGTAINKLYYTTAQGRCPFGYCS